MIYVNELGECHESCKLTFVDCVNHHHHHYHTVQVAIGPPHVQIPTASVQVSHVPLRT